MLDLGNMECLGIYQLLEKCQGIIVHLHSVFQQKCQLLTGDAESKYRLICIFCIKHYKRNVKKANSRYHTHTHLTTIFPGLPRWASTRKVTPIYIFVKQETVSGSGISWAVCKSAPHSRQITMPALHNWVLYWPDALPAAQPTASKHWRQDVVDIT